MKNSIVENQFSKAKVKHRDIQLHHNPGNEYSISGYIGFETEINGVLIKDAFEIKILLMQNYPNRLPRAYEMQNRIPQYFHKYDDSSLCLEMPSNLKMIFKKEPSILGYIDNCLVPYFVNFSFWQKYGKLPFGEWSHAGLGVIKYYSLVLGVKDEVMIVAFLNHLLKEKPPRRFKCYCGSGRRYGGCHKKRLRKLRNSNRNEMYTEYKHLVRYLISTQVHISKKYINQKFVKELEEELRKSEV